VSSRGTYFVSVPRWKSNVPATLATITKDGLLQPYPSWEMNQIWGARAIQSVLGFEIDSKHRLWVLDQGKVNGEPAKNNSIKLVIYDLNQNKEIKRYIFSNTEANYANSFLNDIVVDVYRDIAYISDSGMSVVPATANSGQILVYNFRQNRIRKVLFKDFSAVPDSTYVTINNFKVFPDGPMQTGADGIALTPDAETLFYCPLTSRTIFKIKTNLLRNFTTTEQEIKNGVSVAISESIKGSASDGLAFSNQSPNTLYMTMIEKNSISYWQPNDPGNVQTIAFNNTDMVWPDTIGFDHKGNLVFTTNRLYKYVLGTLNWKDINYRIWSININADSYSFPPNK